jgi:hypothetical protein
MLLTIDAVENLQLENFSNHFLVAGLSNNLMYIDFLETNLT